MDNSARLDTAARLMDEAEQTLHAIRHGAVDAFVVEEPDGHRVYALDCADLPYNALVERMQQGAAMLDASGCIIYCNLSLAELLGVPRDTAIGLPLRDFIARPNAFPQISLSRYCRRTSRPLRFLSPTSPRASSK
jgi:PAS domain-containing protein